MYCWRVTEDADDIPCRKVKLYKNSKEKGSLCADTGRLGYEPDQC